MVTGLHSAGQYHTILIMCVGILFSACTSATVEVRDSVPEPESPHRYLSSILHESSCCLSSSGIVKAKITTQDGTFSARNKVFLRTPDSIRLEVLGMFGHPSLVMVACNGNLNLYIPSERMLYYGDATSDVIALLTGMELLPSEILEYFSGIPDLPHPLPSQLYFKTVGSLFEYTLESKGTTHYLKIDPHNRWIVEYTRIESDNTYVRVTYKSFDSFRSAEAAAPRYIELYFSSTHTRCIIEFESRLCRPPPSKIFSLETHESVKKLPLSEFVLQHQRTR